MTQFWVECTARDGSDSYSLGPYRDLGYADAVAKLHDDEVYAAEVVED